MVWRVAGWGLKSAPAALPSPHVVQPVLSADRETVGELQAVGPEPLSDPNAAVIAPFELMASARGGFVDRGPSTGSLTGFDQVLPSLDWLNQTVRPESSSSSCAAKIETNLLLA